MHKGKNDLRISMLSYRKSYYFRHPIRFIRDIYWGIRNFIHRGRYGYSYTDAWNWFNWWPVAGAEALRYMAENGCAYPGCEPWETPEKWKAYLLDLADRLEWCAKSQDDGFVNEEEERKRDEKCQQIFAEIGKNLGRFWD